MLIVPSRDFSTHSSRVLMLICYHKFSCFAICFSLLFVIFSHFYTKSCLHVGCFVLYYICRIVFYIYNNINGAYKMFEYVKLKNYKSFGDVEFNLLDKNSVPKKLILIYGKNGVGKSNLASSFLCFQKHFELWMSVTSCNPYCQTLTISMMRIFQDI